MTKGLKCPICGKEMDFLCIGVDKDEVIGLCSEHGYRTIIRDRVEKEGE